MAQDLIPKIFATVPTCDGVGVAATCRTWNSEWREELRRRKLPLRLTNSICPLLTLPAWQSIQGPEERNSIRGVFGMCWRSVRFRMVTLWSLSTIQDIPLKLVT